MGKNIVRSVTEQNEHSNEFNAMLKTIRENCPPLKTRVINSLPGLVIKSMRVCEENTDKYDDYARNILYFSMLASLGICFPTVRITYGTSHFSINPSVIIGAPSASNKNLLKFAGIILNQLNNYLIEEYKQALKEWKRSCTRWEQEMKIATKEKREPNYLLEPGDEPTFTCIKLSANISKAMLVELMKANQQFGSIVSSTEGDTFNDANSKEYGKMSDVINKAIVNELVDKAFKVDGTPVVIEFPMLTILISGTFDQIHRLIDSYETGTGSRLPVFLSPGIDKFISQKPQKDAPDYAKYYDELGAEVLEMWKFFTRFYFTVVFTDQQWEEHTEMWSEEFDEVMTSRQEMLSVSTRFGLHHMRFAAVLTMLRLWDKVKNNQEEYAKLYVMGNNHPITCSDEDFHHAGEIAKTLFNHTMMFSTTKVTHFNSGVKAMEPWRWQHEALKVMDNQFTTQEFIAVGKEKFKKSEKTCYRVLKELSKGKGKVIKKLKTKVDGKLCYEKVNIK